MEHSRRTVIKAGAWAAPVIALATVAPAHAASQPVPPPQLQLDAQLRSQAGNLAFWGVAATPTASDVLRGTLVFSVDFSYPGVFLASTFLVGWSEPVVSGSIYTFTYLQSLPKGQTSAYLLLEIGNRNSRGGDTVYAFLDAFAPGYAKAETTMYAPAPTG